jgi:putative transposase
VDGLGVSERRACRVLGQSRATQRYLPQVRDDEEPLTQRIIELASLYGTHGTPRITRMLHREGWRVNHKRVERIWRAEGLKVPRKQPKRGRLWLNDGS